MPRKPKTKKRPQPEQRLTMEDVVLKKRNAKNALINVIIDDDNIFTITLRQDGDSLYIECVEDANPDTTIVNSYPEYFNDGR